MAPCTRQVLWYYYVAASLATFFGGLVILVPARLCWYVIHQRASRDKQRQRRQREKLRCFSRMRAQAAMMISGHASASKTLIIFIWLVNMAAGVLYLVEATLFTVDVCGPVLGDVTQYAWFAFCGIFVIHYIIRFVAAPDKCYMWLDLYSIVDHFTIGPIFMGLYLDQNWLGLRFLRLLYVLQLPDILQLMHLIKSKSSIRLLQIASIFSAIWLCSSGFVHITENTGDPFHDYSNGQYLTFWECVYWLLVTMSTVGYGEISPATNLTRAFIVVFIMGSFAMFTTVIPELAASLGHNSKYYRPYKRIYGKKHIVVCGNISTNTVTNFIKNFLHEDSKSANIDVVFVDRKKPGLEMEAFFKRHFNDVKFIRGSVMDLKTLEGVKLRYASACLILTDRSAHDPESEDAGNIMRVTAVKNYSPDIRVIVQLLKYKSKLNLLHIPNWNWNEGDEVICISELKNGILAQNCLAPGICTWFSNLFTMRSVKKTACKNWIDLYQNGSGNEIYAETLSPAFVGMSFSQAAVICFAQLGVLLLGVHVTEKGQGRRRLKVNPTDFVILADTVGFFIAQSPDDVAKVTYFSDKPKCSTDNPVDKSPLNGRPSSSFSDSDKTELEPIMRPRPSISSIEESYLEYMETVGGRRAQRGSESTKSSLGEGLLGQKQEILDITGTIHWCQARSIDDCTLDSEAAFHAGFDGHVVVCLNATENCNEAGLVSFVAPLRASSIRHNELRDIIIVGKIDIVRREWKELANFPRLYVLPESDNLRTDLRAVRIQACGMCVVMTANGKIKVDEILVDKDSVLTTLSIKSLFGSDIESRVKKFGVLTNPDSFRKDMGVGHEVPTVTELEIEANVAYIDPDDDDDPSVPLYMTMPYMSGKAFVSSVLDSLVSCTYLNGDVLTLIRALVTGGETAEVEQILSEGLGIVRKNTLIDVTSARKRSRLAQMSLSCGPLEKLKHGNKYGELFTKAMENYRLICLGLYRLIDPDSSDPRNRNRVVLCNPNYNLELLNSDRVFVLQPFEMPYAFPGSSSKTTFEDVAFKNDEVFSLGREVLDVSQL